MKMSSLITKNSTKVVQVNALDDDGIVTVTLSNEDRFSIRMRRAAEILQLGNRLDELTQQFKVLLNVLANWLKDRTDISSAHITQRDGALACVVVRTVAEYDPDFEDALSDLDMEIANDPDLNLVRLRMVSLPCVSEDSLLSFLDPTFSLSLSNVWQGK